MIEQDGEITARLRTLGLLVQRITRYGHQIGPVSISRVIHRPPISRTQTAIRVSEKRKEEGFKRISSRSARGGRSGELKKDRYI